MSEKQIIAIAFSDLHLNDWKQFNKNDRRIIVSDQFLLQMFQMSEELEVPALFTGDLFHTDQSLSNKILGHYMEFFEKAKNIYPKARVIGITGNHDSYKGYSYMRSFSYPYSPLLNCIDDDFVQINNDTVVIGIPYLKNNKGFNDRIEKFSKDLNEYRKILLIHTNLYGAKDPNGYEIDEVPGIPRNLGKYFKSFDLVLAGHIHKHDKLWGEKVYMIGAPFQQRSSDNNTDMGYLVIYEDLTIKFIPYEAPGFTYYNEGEPEPDDDNYHIMIPKVFTKTNGDSKGFSNSLKKDVLAREYFKVNELKNKKRLRLLIDILNKTEE